MKFNVRDSRWFGHAIAFSATLLLGVAIAVAQNKVAVQAETKNPNPKNSPAAAAVKAKGETAPADEKARTRRGHALGLTVDAEGDQGIVISKVEESGVAAKAGLRSKDRIVSVDNRLFKRPRQLEAYLASHGGRSIPVVVIRDGQQQTVLYTPPYRADDSAWLGVYLEEGDTEAKGARITQVYPGGPAARAGLHPGDTITQVDDQKIDTPADLIATIASLAPQSQTQFTVLRNDQEEKVDVTLGAHHAFAQQGAGRSGPGGGAEGQFQNGQNAFDNVPPHAMQLEQDRRSAEQHQRIENEIKALREEIRQLRDELKERK